MAQQHIYATSCGRCGCAATRPAISLPPPLPAPTRLLPLASSSSSTRLRLRRRRAPTPPMGASDHLGLAAVAAAGAKPRNGGSRPCAAVLGEPLPALDDPGLLVHPSNDFAAQALVSSTQQYREMYQRSIDDPAGFWSEIADQFYWKQKWSPDEVCAENLDVTKGPIKIEWFKGGKTNICYNAVDRHVEAGNGDKIAMYWEGNEPSQDGKLTYSELQEKVCQESDSLPTACGFADRQREGSRQSKALPTARPSGRQSPATAVGKVQRSAKPSLPTAAAVGKAWQSAKFGSR